MTEKDEFKAICDLTTKVMGLRKGSLSYKTREHKYQIPRMVASMIALKEQGLHKTIIAEGINRDRTLINHYEVNHEANIRWEKYRSVFNKIYKEYKKEISSKKVFKDKREMKRYIFSNGVKLSEKSEILILVTSGQIQIIIPTSYVDFSNQIEIIKFILRDYLFKLEIK